MPVFTTHRTFIYSSKSIFGLKPGRVINIKAVSPSRFQILSVVSALVCSLLIFAPQPLANATAAPAYSIGDTGPGGGKIFYYSAAGFNCGPTAGNTCNYLEAAPSGWNSGSDPTRMYTTNNGLANSINQESAIGIGYKNSLALISAGYSDSSTSAAKLARDYSGGGRADWYLPSKDELNQMCKWVRGQAWGSDATVCNSSPAINTGLGAAGFSDNAAGYWSSTNGSNSFVAWYQSFSSGAQSTQGYQADLRLVRPIRAFNARPIFDFQAANYTSSNGQWTNNGTEGGTVTRTASTGTSFPSKGSTPDSVEFNGSTNGYQFITSTQYSNPQSFSFNVWFKTTGTGKIVGFENSTGAQAGSSWDRLLYVGTNGRLYFGVTFGQSTIVSTGTVNNGQWRNAIGVFSGGTVTLYLDGSQIGTASNVTTANYSGFWRIGGYKSSNWTSTSDGFFSGSIGQVSIYDRGLSSSEAANAFSDSRSTYGVVSCGTSGVFWVESNVVTSSSACVGSVVIPEGVTSIADSAFYSKGASINSVSLPSTLVTISDNAFRVSGPIQTLNIPANVTTIGTRAFSLNSTPRLTTLTFSMSSKIDWIKDFAFEYSNFTSVIIPSSLTKLGGNAFISNSSLTQISFEGNAPGNGGGQGDFNVPAGTRAITTTLGRSSFVTPPTTTWRGLNVVSPPDAPTSLSATAGDSQISIDFTAGANNGSALTNYKYSLDNSTYTAFSPSDTTTPLVIPGLTNGTSYTIRLKAVNAAGDSVASSSVTATPVSPLTVISVAAIGGVTAPVTGATPVTTVTAANGYTGTVNWSGSPTTFASATAYTATITLTATAGFTLSGVTANFFTVAGATSVSHSANSGTITVVFPTTAASEQSTSSTPAPPPPSFLKVKTSPTISLTANIYTCDAGTLIFWRHSLTEEPSKLAYQKIFLLRDGTEVAAAITLNKTTTFERTSTWTGSTMTCQIYAVQENTVSTFSSLGADKYNELSRAKSAAIKASEAKHFADRRAANDKRRFELARIAELRVSDLKSAKTSAQVRAASEKYRLALTRTTDTWKAEIKATSEARIAARDAATTVFTQGLAAHGLAIVQP
jgi:hypothetical protein